MRKLIVSSILALVVGWVTASGAVMAATVASSQNVKVASDQTIDDDYFASGSEVSIEGVVNGDVYVAAERLIVSGVVNGDVIAAAREIEISGQIRDDLVVAAQTVNLKKSQVGDSVVSASETTTLDSESKVGGGLLFAASNYISNASVGRGILGTASNLTINNLVAKNIQVDTDRLFFGAKADVAGDVIYSSDREAQVQGGGRINGRVQRTDKGGLSPVASLQLARFAKAFLIWSYLSAILVGVALIALFRRPTEAVAQRILARPGSVIGWGALATLLTLPLAALLTATVVGIPLAVLLLGLFGALWYLAKIFAGLALGRWLLSKLNQAESPNTYAAFVVGISVIYLLKIIPLINLLVGLAVLFAGLGGFMVSLRTRFMSANTPTKSPKPRAKPKAKPAARKAARRKK
jgi:cytoskeletal protein CcmA (bactofilin family)